MNIQRLGLIALLLLLLAACNAVGGGTPLPTEAPTAEPPAPPTESPTDMPTDTPTETPMETPTEMPDPLAGTRWDLVAYGPDAGQAPVSPATADFADGQVRGTTGCNQYFGGYTLDGAAIAIGPVGQTEMACLEEGVMAQESAFTAALGAATGYALDGEQLTIEYEGGRLVFAAAMDLALEGPTWQSNGMNEGGGISFQAGDERITAQFVDGRVAGYGGCNQYSASYERDGAQLTIGPIVSTKMLCGGGASEREALFLDLLGRAEGFEIDRESLRLLDGSGAMLLGMVPAAPEETEADPAVDAFLTSLQDAVAARDFATLESLMTDPVAFGAYRSEWQTLAPAEMIEGLRQVHLPEGASVVFSPPGTDLVTMLDGMDPTQMLGPDREVVLVVHSTGWREGAEEMMLFIVRGADDNLALGALLYAPEGFQ